MANEKTNGPNYCPSCGVGPLQFHLPGCTAVTPDTAETSPLDVQVGGGHYKSLAIQPVEYIHKNGIGFCEGSAIKYLTRWRSKGGIEDLKKARHFIDLLIELETKATAA